MSRTDDAVRSLLFTVQQANARYADVWDRIANHLRHGVSADPISAESLRRSFTAPQEYLGSDGKRHRRPTAIRFGPAAGGRARYEAARREYEAYSAGLRSDVETANAALDHWVALARRGDPAGVNWYCRTVLVPGLFIAPGGTGYAEFGYDPIERHLVIDRAGTHGDVAPPVDHIEVMRNLRLHEIEVPERARRDWYLNLMAQIALLTVHRVLTSDIGDVVDTVTVNCLTAMANPATGHLGLACDLSLMAPRTQFLALQLHGVEPVACVAGLGGRMTTKPGEYAPIQPLRTASEMGTATLSVTGTPLQAMAPAELEQHVTELLMRMGLKAVRKGATGDGGVDVEALDDRAVVGGKVIVQVKRYSAVVPPAVVRELYGTVIHTGATKGVLMTTSGFSAETRRWAHGKPIELINGAELEELRRRAGLSVDLSARTDTRQLEYRVSPDGRYFWNGDEWVPIDVAVSAVRNSPG